MNASKVHANVKKEILSNMATANKRSKERPVTGITVLKTLLVDALIIFTGIVLNVLQLLLFPLHWLSPEASYYIHSTVCFIIWWQLHFIFDNQDGFAISFSGLGNIPSGESAIVISNHCFFGDFFLINMLSDAKGMLGYCRYFMKSSVKRIPIFGVGMYLARFPFLKRDWSRDAVRIKKSIQFFLDHKLPVYLVSHVEGTRFTQERSKSSNEYAAKIGLPPLKYVVLPRSRGFYATVLAVQESHINVVYDVTLAYYHRTKGFGVTPTVADVGLCRLGDYRMHVHVDRIPLESVPTTEDDATKWLYDKYYAKDALMGQIKECFESTN